MRLQVDLRRRPGARGRGGAQGRSRPPRVAGVNELATEKESAARHGKRRSHDRADLGRIEENKNMRAVAGLVTNCCRRQGREGDGSGGHVVPVLDGCAQSRDRVTVGGDPDGAYGVRQAGGNLVVDQELDIVAISSSQRGAGGSRRAHVARQGERGN